MWCSVFVSCLTLFVPKGCPVYWQPASGLKLIKQPPHSLIVDHQKMTNSSRSIRDFPVMTTVKCLLVRGPVTANPTEALPCLMTHACGTPDILAPISNIIAQYRNKRPKQLFCVLFPGNMHCALCINLDKLFVGNFTFPVPFVFAELFLAAVMSVSVSLRSGHKTFLLLSTGSPFWNVLEINRSTVACMMSCRLRVLKYDIQILIDWSYQKPTLNALVQHSRPAWIFYTCFGELLRLW